LNDRCGPVSGAAIPGVNGAMKSLTEADSRQEVRWNRGNMASMVSSLPKKRIGARKDEAMGAFSYSAGDVDE